MKALVAAGAAVITYCSLLIPLSHAQPGSLDFTFNPGSGANNTPLCAALQTNGQIIIGGNFSTVNNATRHYVARLNPDGSLDSSFDVGVGPQSSVHILTVQDDGKILIGGTFDSINGLSYSGLARLRPDGSVDTTFPNMLIYATALGKQTDGSILVNAYYPASPPQSNCIVRLTEAGVLDPSFRHAFFTGGDTASAFAFQSSGQVIVAGGFSEISGSTLSYLARLNTNGGLDTNFNAGIAGGSVYCLAITPQDQIIIGGSFSSVNGYSRVGVARLNADGTVDATFNPGLGVFSGFVEAIALEQDGKMFIGGAFTGFDGTNRSGLARLNTDGSLDLSFDPKISSGGLNGGLVTSLLSQPDGKLIVGGGASDFNGTQMNGIARLYTDSSPTNALQFLATGQYFGTFLQGVVSNTYRIEWTTNLNTPSLWTPLFNVTLQANPQFVADPNPPLGQRFYRAVQVSP